MRHLIFISLCSLLWTACGNTDNDFDASGTFEATEILVSSEANGKIMELNIEEGDRLDAGAIVGYVDSTQLFLRKMQLSASLRSVDIRKPDIRKQIAVLEQQIATAKTEQQRQENLVRAKAGNQKQLDDIVNNIKYLQKQLDAQYSSLSKTTGGADAEAEGLQYQIMQLDDQLMKSQYPQSPDRYGDCEIRRAGRGDGGRQTALQDRRYGLALSPCLCDGGSVIPPETRAISQGLRRLWE